MARTEEIMAALKAAIAQRFKIDMRTFDDAARLADMGMDSLLMTDLMLELGEVLDFRMEDLDLGYNPSISEVAVAIARVLEKQGQIAT